MKSMSHIAPLLNALFKNKLFFSGFAAGRNLQIFNYCAKAYPELSWDINNDFPFNPKYIPKLKNRKLRKSGYQSFVLYKKSFKPRPKPKLRIFRDEWITNDMVDAFRYSFMQLKKQITKATQLVTFAFSSISWADLNDGTKKELPKFAVYRGIPIELKEGP